MSRSKHTQLVCGIIVALMLAVTVLFVMGEGLGIESVKADMPYVTSLFDTDRVHTLDIVVDEAEWQAMLDNASAKEYIPVNVIVDGTAVKNVGLRTKGNSSLSTMVTSDSDRYSFKVEFDHYQDGQTYLGLDKLALNNITQDDTYLKDYLAYRMMDMFGADAPLCSFIWITVNGEDFGLYLAVEGIEESFAQRTYGADYGQIYKPDSMSMGGGGNGGDRGNRMQEMDFSQMPDMSQFLGEDGMPDFEQMFGEGGMPDMSQLMGGNMPAQGAAEAGDAQAGDADAGGQQQAARVQGGLGGGFGGFGGSSDVSLQYIDDDPDSYPNIFDNAVFSPTEADEKRFIASLKQLDSGENLEEIMDVNEVLRYFVVHNFVLNFDSYTGSMVHNYYVYEKDGVLSMIAWDYNLSFGGFAMGGVSGGDSGTSLVNYPIDSPVSTGSLEDRPMIGRLLADEGYLEQYHDMFDAFLQQFFRDGDFVELIDNAIALISPYVEKDPTAFCSYESFLEASSSLRAFCLLRAQSIEGQLNGTIPSTSEGQAADASALIDASAVDMDSINGNSFGGNRGMWGGGGARQNNDAGEGGGEAQANAPPENAAQTAASSMPAFAAETATEGETGVMPEGFAPPESMTLPEGFTPPAQGEGMGDMARPEGAQMPDMGLPQATGEADPTAADMPEESAAPADETAAGEPQATTAADARGWNRMDMGGMMPGVQQGTQQDDSTTYILLAASAAILLLGLLFAFLYRRRR